MNWHPPHGDEGARACEYNGSPTLQTSLRPHLFRDSVVLTSRAIELVTLITGEYLAQYLAIRIRRLGDVQGKGNSRRQVNNSVALTFAARIPLVQECACAHRSPLASGHLDDFSIARWYT